jgi:hypothetical protein
MLTTIIKNKFMRTMTIMTKLIVLNKVTIVITVITILMKWGSLVVDHLAMHCIYVVLWDLLVNYILVHFYTLVYTILQHNTHAVL